MNTGRAVLIAAAGLALIIGIGALALAMTPWRLRWEKSKDPAADRWSRARTTLTVAMGVVTATCAVVVALTGGKTVAGTQQPFSLPVAGAVRFTDPQDLSGQQLPQVGCNVNVSGTGSLPAGDVLVLGISDRDAGSELPLDAGVQWPSANSWRDTVYLANASDTGHIFDLTAVVMPQAWKDYLLDEAMFYDPKSGLVWWSQGEPPPPAEVEASVAVFRVPVKGGCP